jgi:hypothetical protein
LLRRLQSLRAVYSTEIVTRGWHTALADHANVTYRREISAMKRAKIAALLPVLTLLAVATPAAAAQAKTAATRAKTAAAQDTTYTCYSNTPFSFNVANSDVVNKQVTTTLAGGTPIPGGFVAQSDPPYYPTMTSGPLVESFTNETTQKTIVRNASGPNWFTYDPAPKVPGALATGTYVTTGTAYQLFGPLSEAALNAAGIHEPTLVFTTGLLVMRFVVTQTGAYVTSFSLKGTQENGCAELSGSS